MMRYKKTKRGKKKENMKENQKRMMMMNIMERKRKGKKR